MILRTAASILAAVSVVAQPRDLVATFKHGVNPAGIVTFDLRIPLSSWAHFSHGEPFDETHQELGPYTRQVVYELIDASTSRVGICPHGWVMGTMFLDGEDTHHFSGVCLSGSTAT